MKGGASALGFVLFVIASCGFGALYAQENPCALLPDAGPCEAAIPAWYFDQDFGACTQFSWGGCAGTVPFETLADCLAADCPSENNMSGLCDSIHVGIESVGTADVGHMEILVAPDYNTPYWFGYAGFALFDLEGNLLAAENVSSAPNAYGFNGQLEPHLRYLEYQNGVDLSTWTGSEDVELRLYEGWMAGQAIERCTWLWSSFGSPTSSVGSIPWAPHSMAWRTYDLLGRPVTASPGQLLIERSSEGRTRKVFIIE